jgi:5S rRNA maturation endonuclease (ribonuclease M5)
MMCHAGCDVKDIVAEIGLAMTDLFDEPLEKVSQEVARYHYTNLDGDILFTKIRYEPKKFSIGHENGNGWEWGLGDARRVLYRLPEVKAAIARRETIYVVEGEKDADRLTALGYTATCNFDGANKPPGKPKWRADYTDMLAGADNVVIIADRDEAGYAHANAVKDALTGRVKRVKILQSAVDKPGADVSDHLAGGYTVKQLLPLRHAKYTKIDWAMAWKEQPDDVEWLIEPIIEAGTINSLFAIPGAGKSLISLEIALTLVREGKPVVYIDDENRQVDTVERLKAFGASPEELDLLSMYNFAGLPALDTPCGGQDLLEIAQSDEAALVILDTTSRLVAGKENDADTYLQFYRCSLIPLKGAGIACLRLDHPGKDMERGERGSSAKRGDVDTTWALSKDTDDRFCLECLKCRTGRVEQGHMVFLTREYNPLRHRWDLYPNVPKDKVEALVYQMVRFRVPFNYGRDRVRDILAEHHVTARNEYLGAAIAAYRKTMGQQSVPDPPEKKNWWDD